MKINLLHYFRFLIENEMIINFSIFKMFIVLLKFLKKDKIDETHNNFLNKIEYSHSLDIDLWDYDYTTSVIIYCKDLN